MAAQPIYVETEEEIPEVVERLKRVPAEEVPIVIPARSRLGQSRFNFQLLRHYAGQLGKKVAIISTEAAVQQMAQETGLEAFEDVHQYGGDHPLAVAPAPAAPTPRTWLNPLRPAPAQPRVEVSRPQKVVSRRATELRPGQLFLYTGTALVVVMGMLALAIYVPSASVTLVAQASPFEQPNIEIQAEPGKPPVRIRTLGDTKQESQGFKSTGFKETPALQATGNAAWTNTCPDFDAHIFTGQRLISGTGWEFAVTQGATAYGDPSRGPTSVLTPIKSVAPGVGANVGAHTITTFYPASKAAAACLKVDNPEATAGGQDAKKDPQMTQSDFDAARAQLEQELRKEIADDLNNQIQSGEKLSDLISFDAPDFATDHKPGDTVPSFGGTMTLHGEGAYYFDADVRKALEDTLKKRVPVGSVLTDNKIQTDYRVSHESPGGHLTFLGSAHAFIGPQLNYEQIRNRLAGKPTGQARTYLESLPVRSVAIAEKPINLPFMPMLVSRIDIRYTVEPTATKPPPGG